MKASRNLIPPTEEEDRAITAAALADPDAPPLTDAQLATMAPAKPRGRPRSDSTKEQINIRLSPDVLEAFRATGAGWQTRIDGALREWIVSHPTKR